MDIQNSNFAICFVWVQLMIYIDWRIKLQMFKNEVSGTYLDPRRMKLMSNLVRILHNSNLWFIQDSQSSSVRMVKCRRLWWAGHMARMGKTDHAYRIFLWKTLWEHHLEDWEDDIKMDLQETGCENGRWIELSQGHVQ